MSIRIEVFYTPGCGRCERVRDTLKEVAKSFGDQRVTWCEVNLLDELDYAVRLGVLMPPSMAIDGELVFARLPRPARLRKELSRRLAREQT